MWTERIFVAVFLLRCAVSSSLPKPINVSFTSVNLRNVLHWFPGNGTPDGTHFTVEFVIYGDSTPVTKGKGGHWRAVHQCTNIVRTWCDLSAETWAEEEGYYARVCALGKKSTSKCTVTKRRFDPKWDTIFGPPLVSVEIENNSAIVTLKGPMRYSPNNNTPPLSMKAIYSRMSYNLSIYNIYRNQMHHFPVETSPYKYQLLDYNTEYCFFAKSRFLSIPVQCKSSAWHCIITPQDPVIKQLQQVVVGIVVPSLCICIIVLVSYPLYNYLAGKGQKSPFTLNRPSFHPNPLVLLPDNVNLEITRIIAHKPPPCIDIPSIIAYPQYRYSSQGPDVPREPEEPMNDLSNNYGSVLAPKVKVHEEADTRQRKHEDGHAVNNLTSERQECADSYKKQDVKIKDDDAACGYKPQAQRFGESPMVEPAQTKVSTLLLTRPRSQGNLALLSQTRAPIQSNETSVSDKQTMESNTEGSALFFNNKPQMGTFNVHLNLPVLKEGVKSEEVGEQKRNQCENVPLLSDYASQNIPTMPSVHSQKSDCLSDDYGVLFSAAAQRAEAGNVEVEMEKGARCSNQHPEIMKLVLPWMEMSDNKEERLDCMLSSERRTEGKIEGNREEMYMIRSHLKLESVFIRQASDEEAGPHIEGESGSEADDILSKWDLVISMGE